MPQNDMDPGTNNDRGVAAGWGIPAGVATGAATGMLIGILVEQFVLGLILGAAVGLLAGSLLTAVVATPRDRRASVFAVTVALLTVGAVAVLLILLR